MRTYDEAILAVPRRLAGVIEPPLQAQLLTSLPQNPGDMGYRTWHATADCAALATYAHVPHLFVVLFPAFTVAFPNALDPKGHDAAAAVSGPALGASRALVRAEAVAPGTRQVPLRDAGQPNRRLQHMLSVLTADAAHERLVEKTAECKSPPHPRHMAVHLSVCGDSSTVSVIPRDEATTLSNAQFTVLTRRRTLLPIDHKSGGGAHEVPCVLG